MPGKTPIIDVSTHICPPRYRKAYYALAAHNLKFPENSRARRCYELGKTASEGMTELWDLETRSEMMDRAGITTQALTLAYPTVEGLNAEQEVKLAREVNDEVANLISRYDGRFVALATLPYHDIDAAVDEFDRAVGELGMRGAHWITNVDGKGLDGERQRPILERAVKHDLPIYLHPTTPLTLKHTGTQMALDLVLGWPLDTTFAVVKLVLAGLLDQYPNLKLITHHMAGGLVPFFPERFDNAYGSVFREWPQPIKITKPPSEYFKRLYADTVAGADQIALGVRFFGGDHVLFGSDYPFVPVEPKIRAVQTLPSPEATKIDILYRNAERLLKL